MNLPFLETIDMAKKRLGANVYIQDSPRNIEMWLITKIENNKMIVENIDRKLYFFKETFLARCKELGLNEKGEEL